MKYKKQKSITEFEKQDIKKRFKMYKSKKRWVIAPILFLGLGGILVIEAPSASAEETQTYEKQAPIENESSYKKEGESKIETSDGILLPEENSSKVSEGTESDPKTPQEVNIETEHSSEPVVSTNKPQPDVVDGAEKELELSQNTVPIEVVTPEPVSPVHDGEPTKIDAQNAKNSSSQDNLSKEDANLVTEQINAEETKSNQQLNFSKKRSIIDDKNDNKLSRVKRADDTISNTTDSKEVKFQQLECPIKYKLDNNEFPSIKDNNSGLVVVKGEPDQQSAIPAEYAFYPKFIEGKTTVQIDGNDVNTIDINNNFAKHYVNVRNVGYLENSDPIDILITFQKEEFNGVEKIPDLNEQDETIINIFDDPNELISVGGENLALNVTMEFFNGKTGLPIEMSGYNTITDLDWTEYYIYEKNMIEKIIVPQSSLIKTKEHENNLYLIGISDDITPTHDYQAVGAERGQVQVLFKKSHTWKYHINIKSSASFNVSKSLLPIDFTSPIVVGDEEDANIKDDQLEYKVYVNIPYRDDKTGDKQQYSLDIKLPDAFRFKTLKIKDNAEKDISDKFLIDYDREKSIATVTPKDTSNDKYDLNIQVDVSSNINNKKEAKEEYYNSKDAQYKVPITAELRLSNGTSDGKKILFSNVATSVIELERSQKPSEVTFEADPSVPTKGKLEGNVPNVPTGTQVMVITPTGEEINGETDPDGHFSIPVERKEEDELVSVVVNEKDKASSDPVETQVPKQEHSATPTEVVFIADPTDPTKGRLEGKVSNISEGTQVVATTPEGEELHGETDPEGHFSIPVERKEEDIPVQVVIKEEGKVPSDSVTTQVPKQEPSATPTKVEFVSDPNDPTKGKLEGKVSNVPEGTKVVVTTPEGEELSGTTDPEGRFSFPVERGEEDIPVNVVVQEEGKVPSEPVSVIVSKVKRADNPELEKLSSSRKKNQSSKADGQVVKRELSQMSPKNKEKDLNNTNNLQIVTGNTPTNDSSKNEKMNNHNSTNLISGGNELPKTGAQAHLEMSIIGTLLTGLSGVSLFGIKKRRKEND
ncbi:LPXTG cell wall anchor domain-containing protein [Enterococcus villorum]|uniref:Gram-positive cocci surface proteins LPxTG domain-containing protein n=2 Tax=Enterococcus villorum TaxID=112904 RepID=A0A511IYT4_9ENTE|nr:LPXTG cell wall anchor domain-containing protein [Enterococcus villorum]EOH87513.1 KxYKxGKxW signal peptide [Enterococcus villorum ATCC 700913]EOW77768.1 hypothetical protein I591_00622 [Enterococcus villorum ATCC 700913]GEL90942.1 hypothetical protein EVI01_02790 [Enterococcus villorum]